MRAFVSQGQIYVSLDTQSGPLVVPASLEDAQRLRSELVHAVETAKAVELFRRALSVGHDDLLQRVSIALVVPHIALPLAREIEVLFPEAVAEIVQQFRKSNLEGDLLLVGHLLPAAQRHEVVPALCGAVRGQPLANALYRLRYLMDFANLLRGHAPTDAAFRDLFNDEFDNGISLLQAINGLQPESRVRFAELGQGMAQVPARCCHLNLNQGAKEQLISAFMQMSVPELDEARQLVEARRRNQIPIVKEWLQRTLVECQAQVQVSSAVTCTEIMMGP